MRPSRLSERRLNELVFINCPFDEAYWPLFRAIVFTILACGYRPRCALEVNDGGSLRLDKLRELIAACDRGVHDLSRVELSADSGTPRFNMPFEFGVAVGVRAFGGARQRRKQALVLARKREHWHPTVSDLAGIEPQFHGDEAQKAVAAVRRFLRRTPGGVRLLPGASDLWATYQRFVRDLPRLARKARHSLNEAYEYDSYLEFIGQFLDEIGQRRRAG
jgi:hypothetical protein